MEDGRKEWWQWYLSDKWINAQEVVNWIKASAIKVPFSKEAQVEFIMRFI